jgi:hypothetical protein
MKNVILIHKLGLMSRDNSLLRQELQEHHQELQELRQDDQEDLRNFNFAVFGNVDRANRADDDSTMTTTLDDDEAQV